MAAYAYSLEDREVLGVLLNVRDADIPFFQNAAAKMRAMFERKSLGEWPDLTDAGTRHTEALRRVITERGRNGKGKGKDCDAGGESG
jgi:hypothetical protein